MERVVVVFDVWNPKINTSSRLVKMWNSDEAASDYVKQYTEERSDLYWGYSDGDMLTDWAPGALIELHGHSDAAHTDVKDIITVYHVEAEDPDADPMKRILHKMIPDFEEAYDDAIKNGDEEAPFLKYAAECFEHMLNKIDEIESNNLDRSSNR